LPFIAGEEAGIWGLGRVTYRRTYTHSVIATLEESSMHAEQRETCATRDLSCFLA
jgi:hypothetical protein